MKSGQSNLFFNKITVSEAIEISGWTYPAPYELYNGDSSQETIEEILHTNYYSARNTDNNLVGYVCFGEGARVPGGYNAGIYSDTEIIDLGLGLKPELTGEGYGILLVKDAVKFLQKTENPSIVQLAVAVFNERAIKVYTRAGFKHEEQFVSAVKGENVEFLSMRLKLRS